jgi:hypothetical protein
VSTNNDSCLLAPLPHFMNVSVIAKQFEQRKNVRVEDSDEVKIFSLKSRKGRLGSIKRAEKIPEVNEQCKDVPMVETEELGLNETEFKKFSSGKVVTIKNQRHSRYCQVGFNLTLSNSHPSF